MRLNIYYQVKIKIANLNIYYHYIKLTKKMVMMLLEDMRLNIYYLNVIKKMIKEKNFS